MTRANALLLAVLASCGRPDEQIVVAAPAAPAAATVDPIAKGVPHGAEISLVAITERGDAALSFDHLGVRLWPTFDGSRPPVPVMAAAPKELALGHANQDLLAAILDEARSVTLLRLGLDGRVRGRAQLPEVGYEEIVAHEGGILASTVDHAVAWYAADGTSRGRLTGDHGERIITITSRRGQAIALISAADGTQYLRWIVTHARIMWGAKVAVPYPYAGIALSPNHRRFAFVDGHGNVPVYELKAKGRLEQIGVVHGNGHSKVGFIDDDHLAVAGMALQWWLPETSSNDPWANTAVTTPPVPGASTFSGSAVADGLVVVGVGTSLGLIDKSKTRYLGWQDLPSHGVMVAVGNRVAISVSGFQLQWLDDRLAIARKIDFHENRKPAGNWIHAVPIGERHVITRMSEGESTLVELVDLDQAMPVKLGVYRTDIDRIEYTANAQLLAIITGSKVMRFKLDLAKNTATSLPSLKMRGSLMSLRLFDPERADGIVSIGTGWENDSDDDTSLVIHHAKGKTFTKTKYRNFLGTVLGTDATGQMMVLTRGRPPSEVRLQRLDKTLSSFKVGEIGAPAAANDALTQVAVYQQHEIVMFTASGTELWRKPLWGASQFLFANDGKQLIVRAIGGILAFDAVTGERVAMECGWGFGLFVKPPQTQTVGSSPVCEDPMQR